MRLSELIKDCERALADFGDLEVVIPRANQYHTARFFGVHNFIHDETNESFPCAYLHYASVKPKLRSVK